MWYICTCKNLTFIEKKNQMKSNNRYGFFLSHMLLFIGIVSLLLASCSQSRETDGSGTKKQVRILPIEAQVTSAELLERKIKTVGNIMADELVDLCFETSGKVIEIRFSEGSQVRKGQVLARVNDAPLQADLKRLKANLPVAQNREARKRELLKTEAISRDDYDESYAKLTELLANIEHTQANIDKCILKAPFDGKIGLRNISEGATVSTNTAVAQMAKTERLKIDFSFPEQYASLVQVGTEIAFKVSDDLRVHHAKVYAIEASVDNATKSLKARAMYDNRKACLSPGRFVSVEVKLTEKPDAIMITSEALTLEMGKAFVFKCQNGKVYTQEIKTGYRNENQVEVLEGLGVGDTIATTGLMQLRQGMQVNITNLQKEH